EVSSREAAKLGIGPDVMGPLSGCGPEGGQCRVVLRVPDVEDVVCGEPDDVVVDDRAGRRAVFDPNVAVRPRAVDAVVDTDVVLDDRAGGVPLDVDAGGHIVVRGVA